MPPLSPCRRPRRPGMRSCAAVAPPAGESRIVGADATKPGWRGSLGRRRAGVDEERVGRVADARRAFPRRRRLGDGEQRGAVGADGDLSVRHLRDGARRLHRPAVAGPGGRRDPVRDMAGRRRRPDRRRRPGGGGAGARPPADHLGAGRRRAGGERRRGDAHRAQPGLPRGRPPLDRVSAWRRAWPSCSPALWRA